MTQYIPYNRDGEERLYLAQTIVVYDKENNQWYDECGKLIVNINEWLEPRYLELFHHGVDYSFPLRSDAKVLCTIFEDWGDKFDEKFSTDSWDA